MNTRKQDLKKKSREPRRNSKKTQMKHKTKPGSKHISSPFFWGGAWMPLTRQLQLTHSLTQVQLLTYSLTQL